MADGSYVVTGAASGIGQSLLAALAELPGTGVVGLLRPAVTGRKLIEAGSIRYIAQDLLEPLSGEVRTALANADRVVHLAWSRAPDFEVCMRENTTMLARLFECTPAERIVFVSSVAAASNAKGVYGRAKYQAQQRVLAAGGTVLVSGLVVSDPPETAYKVLVDTLARVPAGIVPVPPSARVYPVAKQDLIAVIAQAASHGFPSGAYGVFVPGGMLLGDFARNIAAALGRRAHVLPVPRAGIDVAIALLERVGQRKLAEKLSTFFFKNESELGALLDVPGFALRPVEFEIGKNA